MSILISFTVAMPMQKMRQYEKHSSLFIDTTEHTDLHAFKGMKSG